MKHRLKNRILCLFAALWLILSPMLSVLPVRADDVTVPENTGITESVETEGVNPSNTGENETTDPTVIIGAVGAAGVIENAGVETQEEVNYCVQSIEVYPEGEDSDKLIVLEGLMPEDATAEAVDVTEERDGKVIAAYDITIKDDGGEEFQPDEENPINVEISDERISGENENLQLWHILDDGTRIQVTDFTIEEGKICFEAVGFSVYEILDVEDAPKVDDILAYLAERGENGFYVSFMSSQLGNGNNGPYYFADGLVENVRNNGRTGLNLTDKSQTVPENAIKLYFEHDENCADDQFYIYELDENSEKKYIRMFRDDKWNNGRSALGYATDENPKTLFTFYVNNRSQIRISATVNGQTHYWIRNTNENVIAACGYNSITDSTLIWMTVPPTTLGLDGRTYGLMNYTGGTHGHALMANTDDGNVHSLIELVTHQMKDGDGNAIESRVLYVDEGSEVTRWKFHEVGADEFKLSATTDYGEKYLAVQNDELVLVDTPSEGTAFYAVADAEKRIQLRYQNKFISFYSVDNGTSNETGFKMSSTDGADTWLDLIDFATLADENLIAYSADRVSVSEVENGQKVILYTRIWNEETLRYDIYAVDYNGSLYPCYASGGKILWLGDGTGSLEWEFTEYVDPVSKEPNYYYELYNAYSEKYLAPQMAGNQVLSENTIGINMQGRRNGDFYSDIVAWDETYYAYVGLKPNDEKTKLVPCSQSNSIPFYFATLEPLNLGDTLHTVYTLDNKNYGITMRMVDYGTQDDQDAVLGTTTFNANAGERNILSTNLEADGYPITKIGKSLSELFKDEDAIDVNHLFIKSIYNSSGYFEFDSCQNFATLLKPDGTEQTYNGKDPINFTVYRELGTSDNEGKNTLRHGQFLPFNIIRENVFATSKNPMNLFSAKATISTNANDPAGQLSEDDPRKYEKLYKVQDRNDDGTFNDTPNYQNGFELSASFVQTVSGLDAWGHDIVFEFTGDDDFWLYVDDELVIDLGGIHSAMAGSVNFKTGDVKVQGLPDRTLRQVFEQNYRKRKPQATDAEVKAYLAEYFNEGENIFKDYSKHTMKVFYMERGRGASNLHMRFNLASVTPGHVVVSKNIEGEGADLLDKEFLEYPFQIYYTLPEGEDGHPGEEKLLGNHDDYVGVAYQNSNQPVTFVQKYRPAGFSEDQAYENIYFINPTKKAEIYFPDDTITYRIVECAVDNRVYERVLINGQEVPSSRVEIKGDLRSYSSEAATAELKPSISFDNYVNADVVKDLYITKQLLDENDHEITNDPATFSFRLSLSSVAVDADDIPRTNMAKYYVITADKKICKRDTVNNTFEETTLEYSRENIKKIEDGLVDGIKYDDVTFRTSGFGAISGIPAGYTIVVPGIAVGSIFKVTEDVKPGYGLIGYERDVGEIIEDDGTHRDVISYMQYEQNPLNVGQVIAEENPHVIVKNKKGYGLTVKKKWSDLELTTSHDSIYVGVYVDGVLLDGSVKEIKSPSTSTYYFWTTLEENSDGSERTDLTGYEVREVTLSRTFPVDEDGTVTGYTPDDVYPLAPGREIRLTATRTIEATPDNENRDADFDYVVTYQEGTFDGASRTDTISNTRKGGIAIRLFKWDSEVPLKGGSFTLRDNTGKKIDDYVSDSEGIVKMMYDFEYGKVYTLTETSAPEGYVGLQKKCIFVVNDDDSVSLYYEDRTAWGTADSDDTKWVNYKQGNNGITAFIDVYNKQFNFIIAKTDKYDSTKSLGSAHFALYKQVNMTIGGYMKSKDPMTGFEDFSTDGNGNVYVCGGDSGRVIKPGENGSVYFLTEIQAPDGYSKLKDDIVFRISPIGVPSLISDSYNGSLEETEDSYIYTLSVPNEKSSAGFTVTKTVAGNMGNKAEEFLFTFDVVEPPTGSTETEFAWKKNGVEQTTTLQSGDTFTLGHEDSVKILVPEGTKVKITENISSGEGYTTTFKLDNNTPETVTSMEFDVDDGTVLAVVNERNVLVPTGVFLPVGGLIAVTILIWAGVIVTIINRRKYEEEL